MTAILLSPLYLLVNFYILRWLIRYMSACTHHFKKKWLRAVVIALYTFLCTSLLSAFLLPVSAIQRILKHIANYWLGTFLYILLTVAFVDLVRIILKHSKRVNQEKLSSRKTFVLTGTLCIAIILTFSVWGIVNAKIVRTTNYTVDVDKKCTSIESLNVVLVADLHLGYSIDNSQMEQMVAKINAQTPDLVVIAGDIFDNEYEALYEPEKIEQTLRGIKSKYGTYACYGNHDISEKILAGFTFSGKGKKMSDPRMDQFVEDAGIKLLRDDTLLIEDQFYLVSRPDFERPGRGITTRKTPAEITANLDQTKPIIVFEHEPRELSELSAAGADLDLCGHTHDGQMFPGNFATRLMWDNAYGYLKQGKMHSIVTSGVGVFGPNMRVGTKSEIVTIKVNFKR